jgi:hypothetical protein
MTPDKRANFGARFEYLDAIAANWPDVLRSLRDDTFQMYQTCWERQPNSPALLTLMGLLTASVPEGVDDFRQLERAVRKWAGVYGFREEWIWEAAVQTMHCWMRQERISEWGYFPIELEIRRLEPQFGTWIPSFTSWPEFKRSSDLIYRRQRAKYRAEVGKLWGQGQPKLNQQALWTVLWQRGKSPGAIRNYYLRTTGNNVSLANIQQSVHSFANDAGVILRAAKAGRSAKI